MCVCVCVCVYVTLQASLGTKYFGLFCCKKQSIEVMYVYTRTPLTLMKSLVSCFRYGMHEDYDYYMNCQYRSRNLNLFTADQVGF